MSVSGLYDGIVTHRRRRPVEHALRYRVFQIWLDLDEAAQIAARLRFFGFNAPGLISFRETDHGDGSATPLKRQIEARVAAAGHAIGGPVRVLCLPRVFGFVFNPISVFFCHDPEGRLSAILYEVNNTFGDRTAYVAPGERRHSLPKAMHVSPFMDMDHTYRFTVSEPADAARLTIEVRRGAELWLSASLAASRRPLSDRQILAALLRLPFATARVVAAIHWEAIKLWFKGAPYRRKPHARMSFGSPHGG